MAVKKKKESLNDYIEKTLEDKLKKYLERKIDSHILATHSKQINASRKMIDARHKNELAKKFEKSLAENVEINEVSKQLLARYVKKASKDSVKRGMEHIMSRGIDDNNKRKMINRIHGVDQAADKLAKPEKKKNSDYYDDWQGYANESLMEAFIRRTKEQWAKANERTKKWKERGSPKGEVPDSWKKKDEKKKEEVKEEINEISKATLGSYIKKAKKTALDSAYEAGMQAKKPSSVAYITKLDLAKKRSKGISKAVNRLAADDVEDQIKSLIRKKFVNEEAPTNSMGASSSTAGTGPVDTFDPLLSQKPIRRKKVKSKPEGIE